MAYVNMFFAIVFFGIFALFSLCIFYLKYRWSMMELLKNILCFCSIGGLLTVTLFPVPLGEEEVPFSYVSNFIPFHSIKNYISEFAQGMKSQLLVQGIGNVLLFFVFMFVINWCLSNFSFKKNVLIGISASVMIEFIQGVLGIMLGVFYRSVDVDDIILNTIGTVAACFLYSKIKKTNKFGALLQ